MRTFLAAAVSAALCLAASSAFAAAPPPMVSIVSPRPGMRAAPTPVSPKSATNDFKVLVQVWNDVDISPDITAVSVEHCPGATDPPTACTWTTVAAAPTSLDCGGTKCGVYEATLSGLSGSYWLRASAVSTADGTGYSSDGRTPSPATDYDHDPRFSYITVLSSPSGTGMLLGREASSQLCMDCHGPTHGHSSQTTDAGYGNWQTVCFDCHTPHGTTNLYLIKEQILSPRSGLKSVVFNTTSVYNTSGGKVDAAAGAATESICQVCHTQTTFWKNDGTGAHNSDQDCNGCHSHEGGFSAGCEDCHGQPPVSVATLVNSRAPLGITERGTKYLSGRGGYGAHDLHKNGLSIPCADCHNGGQPGGGQHSNATAPTYVNIGIKVGGVEQGVYQAPAIGNVNYALQAGGATTLDIRGSESVPDPRTCVTIYCHGSRSPAWSNDLSSIATCTKCHGYKVAPGSYALVNAAPGSGGTGIDTGWDTGNSDPQVGAHRAHLNTPGVTLHAISNSISCGECHTVPALVNSTGHNDDALPAELNFGTLANTGGLVANYSGPGTRVCDNTWCHGAGLSGGDQLPVWNAPMLGAPSTANCDMCHGFPPPGVSDHTGQGPADCNGCHQHLDTDGFTFNDIAKHLNGVIDGGSCVGCHANEQSGYRRIVTGSTTGDIEPGLTSHHIQNTTAIEEPSCKACHDHGSHRTFTDGVFVNVADPDGGASVVYDGTPGSLTTFCVNCHDANGASRLGANALQPFVNSGDSTQPPNIKTAWTNTVNHNKVNAGCMNCHGNSVAVANTLDPAINAHGSTIVGLLGNGVDPTNGTAGASPTAYTVAALGSADEQYKVCFKCHSDWSGGPTLPANRQNMAVQFNTANDSFHWVESDKGGPFVNPALGTGKGIYATATFNATYVQIMMPGRASYTDAALRTTSLRCSDCHGTDNATLATPNGPHGSGIINVLKVPAGSPYTSWDCDTATDPAADGNGNVNAWCFNCHDPSFTGSGFGSIKTHVGPNAHTPTGSTIDTTTCGYAPATGKCVACHLKNPHGQTGAGTANQRMHLFNPAAVGESFDSEQSGSYSEHGTAPGWGNCAG